MKTRPEWSFTSIFLGVTHESLGFFGLSNEDVFFFAGSSHWSYYHVLSVRWRSDVIIRCVNEWTTWWFIPVSKWIITPVISELTLLSPVITRGITYLLSGGEPPSNHGQPATMVTKLVGGWALPLWKMMEFVSWDYYSLWKNNNCSKPPTSKVSMVTAWLQSP